LGALKVLPESDSLAISSRGYDERHWICGSACKTVNKPSSGYRLEWFYVIGAAYRDETTNQVTILSRVQEEAPSISLPIIPCPLPSCSTLQQEVSMALEVSPLLADAAFRRCSLADICIDERNTQFQGRDRRL
jgi:hypothetical protein